MTLKTLAAIFPPEVSPTDLAGAAAAIARRHDAHLVGVAVTSTPIYHPGISSYVTAEVIEQIHQRQDAWAEEIHEVFEKAVAAEGVRGEWRKLRAGTQPVADRIVEAGRAADAIVLSRPSKEQYPLDAIHGQVVRSAGRPVLILPREVGSLGLHSGCVIGWSPTREAARAAYDALHLLEPDANVTLLNVGQNRDHELADGPMNDLAAALSRHGMKVTVTHRDQADDGIAAVIQREAAEVGAGFIATGAFGHSRAYDFVIGAVSTKLMAECPLPLMLSK